LHQNDQLSRKLCALGDAALQKTYSHAGIFDQIITNRNNKHVNHFKYEPQPTDIYRLLFNWLFFNQSNKGSAMVALALVLNILPTNLSTDFVDKIIAP
jgi:hypothetical protein